MAKHRPLGPGLLLFALIIGVGVGLILWARREAPPPGPDALGRHVLLDTRAALRSDGTEFAFVLREASRVWVKVVPPHDLDGHAVLGLPAIAGRHDIAYAPKLEGQHRWAVGPQHEDLEVVLMSPGTYIVQLEPIPVAMGNESEGCTVGVSIVVRARPLRDESRSAGAPTPAR